MFFDHCWKALFYVITHHKIWKRLKCVAGLICVGDVGCVIDFYVLVNKCNIVFSGLVIMHTAEMFLCGNCSISAHVNCNGIAI